MTGKTQENSKEYFINTNTKDYHQVTALNFLYLFKKIGVQNWSVFKVMCVSDTLKKSR